MLKKLIKYIPFTTLIVSYFFICGGLYLIGFWTTFNIDISNLVSFSDIPKAFILPCIVSQGFFLFNNLVGVVTSPLSKDSVNQYRTNPVNSSIGRRIVRLITGIDFFIILASSLMFYYYSKYKLSSEFWLWTSLFLAFLLALKYSNNSAIKDLIPYYTLRHYFVSTFVFIPIFSFGLGKIKSLNIYNNVDDTYIKIIKSTTVSENNNKDTLKFIGFLGDKLIVSSVDNKTITFINQSSFEEVQILDKR